MKELRIYKNIFKYEFSQLKGFAIGFSYFISTKFVDYPNPIHAFLQFLAN